MRKDLENQSTLRGQMQITHTHEVGVLKKELGVANRKIVDLEKHMKYYRAQKRTEKDDLTQLKKTLQAKERAYNDTISMKQNACIELELKLQQTTIDMDRKYRELKEFKDTLEADYNDVKANLDAIQEQQQMLMEKAQKSSQLADDLAVEQNRRDAADQRVKELTEEVAAFGDWKELSNSFHVRMAKLPTMEIEIDSLKRENKRLLDCIGNKLLLEEEVYGLRDRLAATERNNKEAHELMAQLKTLQQELEPFKKLMADFSPTGPTAFALRKFIVEMLQTNVALTADKNTLKVAKDQIETEHKELRRKNVVCTKAMSDLQTTVKHLQTNAMRYKKKIVVVSAERDCYKQLIDNYEKDLTVSNIASTLDSKDQNRIRMEMLEKTVSGYKDMVVHLETELKQLKSLPALDFDSAVNGMGEHYDMLRKELEVLRQENERLHGQKNSLELALEQISVKGAFNIDKFKVCVANECPGLAI